jgi:hypothetical protein
MGRRRRGRRARRDGRGPPRPRVQGVPEVRRYVRLHLADGSYSGAFPYPTTGKGDPGISFIHEGDQSYVHLGALGLVGPVPNLDPPGFDITVEESDDLVTWSTLAAGAVPGERPPSP